MVQPLSELQKRYLRRLRGTKARFSLNAKPPAIKKTRDHLTIVRPDFVPAKPRGKSGTRLSAEKRSMVQSKAVAREKFHAGFAAALKA